MNNDASNMKPKTKHRLSTKELLLIALPFPILWLLLGSTVDTVVFKFWQTEQKMSSLSSVTLMCVPIGFTFLYSIIIYISYRSSRKIDWATVAMSAVFSYLLASVFCPIP